MFEKSLTPAHGNLWGHTTPPPPTSEIACLVKGLLLNPMASGPYFPNVGHTHGPWFTTSMTSYPCSTITPLLGVQLNLNLKSTKSRQLGDEFEKSPIFAAGEKTINKKWEPLPHRIHGFSVYLSSNLPLQINQI